MAKKLLFTISILCILALTACAAIPVQAAAPTNAASPVQSQPAATASAQPSTTVASASPSASVSASASASPSASVSASASASPSASADASASASESSDDDPGYTLENIIKEDSLNRNYQNTPVPGEDITVTIDRNTLTFNVTLDKDIKPADFTPELQAKYKQDLQNQIAMLSDEYDGLIDCTFIYNLSNKSGDKLMSLTQDFKEQ